MSTFEFKAHHPEHGHVIQRVEADNEREARAYVKTQLFCRKLTAREIIEVSQRGLAIVDAKTGQVIGVELNGGAKAGENVGGNPPGPDAE